MTFLFVVINDPKSTEELTLSVCRLAFDWSSIEIWNWDFKSIVIILDLTIKIIMHTGVNIVIVLTLVCIVIASDMDNQNNGRKLNRVTSKLPTRIRLTTARSITKVRKPVRKPTRKSAIVALEKSKLPVSSVEENGDFFTMLKQAELRGK